MTDKQSKKSSSDVVPASQSQRPARWSPFELVSQMQQEFDRLFNDRWHVARPFRDLSMHAMDWAPRTDVYQQDGNIVVKAEIPGVAKDDVKVKVEQGDLIISGERKSEENVEEKDYYRMERSFGSFYRRLPLPEGVDAKKIKANFSDGVLEVRVPAPAVSSSDEVEVPIE